MKALIMSINYKYRRLPHGCQRKQSGGLLCLKRFYADEGIKELTMRNDDCHSLQKITRNPMVPVIDEETLFMNLFFDTICNINGVRINMKKTGPIKVGSAGWKKENTG